MTNWRKRKRFHDRELERLEKHVLRSMPGSCVHEDLLKQLRAFKEIEDLEKARKTTFLGIKRDTWFMGFIGLIQIYILATLQDKKWMPKNLFSWIVKPK